MSTTSPSPLHQGLVSVRAIACLMVIALHVASPIVNGGPQHPMWEWGQILNALTRSCVALFFMLTGYFFFSTAQPRARHFLRLLGALAFYTAIGWILRASSGLYMTPWDILFVQPTFYHLWYFYAALMVYGVAAVIRIRPDASPWALGGVSALLLLTNPQIGWPLGLPITGDLYLSPQGIGLYLGFALVGASLRRVESHLATPVWRATGTLLALGGMVWVYAATKKDSEITGDFVAIHEAYGSLGPMASAIGIFMLCVAWHPQHRWWNRCTSYIAARSMGIYGIHAFALAIAIAVWPSSLLTPSGVIALLIGVTLFSIAFASVILRVDRQGWIS